MEKIKNQVIIVGDSLCKMLSLSNSTENSFQGFLSPRGERSNVASNKKA